MQQPGTQIQVVYIHYIFYIDLFNSISYSQMKHGFQKYSTARVIWLKIIYIYILLLDTENVID